jgi:hypothetical protein
MVLPAIALCPQGLRRFPWFLQVCQRSRRRAGPTSAAWGSSAGAAQDVAGYLEAHLPSHQVEQDKNAPFVGYAVKEADLLAKYAVANTNLFALPKAFFAA